MRIPNDTQNDTAELGKLREARLWQAFSNQSTEHAFAWYVTFCRHATSSGMAHFVLK
jgi:hypothetical protein